MNRHSSFLTRRAILSAAGLATLAAVPQTRAAAVESDPQARLSALESASGGRLGVMAIDAGSGRRVTHRADERFAFCSTFKVISVGAVLKRSEAEPGLLERTIPYGREQLVRYSPITEQHAGAGMTVSALCAAAMQYSDNTAANLIIALLGGPAAVTAYARGIGNPSFRLDRLETELNTAIPGDERDTSTPAAMAESLQALALGERLAPESRERLVGWMRGNTTGAKRIRAGVPTAWTVGDKTGTGDHGTTNDLGLAWRPGRPPLLLALYFTQPAPDAPARDDVLADATRIIVEALG